MYNVSRIWHMAPLLALAALASCVSEEQRKLDRMVEEQNAQCPIAIAGEGVAVQKVSHTDNTVVYDVKVDDPRLPVKMLSENAEAARKLVSDAIVGSDSPEVRAELETCRDAGATMKYVLTDTKGDTFSIVINPADYLR